MEVRPLLVGKEQVGLPDGIQHGGVQVQRVVWVFVVGQPGVVPLLPQEDVDPVVLRAGGRAVGSALGLGGPPSEAQVLSASAPQGPSGGSIWGN